MQNENTQSTSVVCMACTCPCEMHKEHSHSVEEIDKQEKPEEGKSCSMCGTPHKQDNTPACGCN